jgi:NAD(P)-dependent dehydrogenase (short-subunit alcohol dehydrogenase family)
MGLCWVVTGANRGIGLEFAKQLIARGDRVIATVRDAKRASALRDLAQAAAGTLEIFACDTASDSGVESFCRAVGERAVDVLINNAGVIGSMTSLEELDFADITHTFDVNALGPLRVTRGLLGALERSATRRVVSISSGMGSIADNANGGAYGYRLSKAALNMANRSMSVDLRERGFTCVVLNPGWVQTDMGGSQAPLPVDRSVRSMLDLIERLTPQDNGRFLNVTGNDFPW